MNELIKRLEELEADVRTSGYFETPACEIADIRASIGELAAIVREVVSALPTRASDISHGTQKPPDC